MTVTPGGKRTQGELPRKQTKFKKTTRKPPTWDSDAEMHSGDQEEQEEDEEDEIDDDDMEENAPAQGGHLRSRSSLKLIQA